MKSGMILSPSSQTMQPLRFLCVAIDVAQLQVIAQDRVEDAAW